MISGRFTRSTLNEFGSPRRRARDRPRLDDQCAVAGNLVAFRRVADVADVQMSGEKQVGANLGELRHRDLRAADEVLGAVGVGQIERVMRDDDLDQCGGRRLRRRSAAR